MSNSGDSKHTPGPWFDRPDHDPVLIQGASEVGLSIAFACGGGDPKRSEYVANARLIAASPELLDVVKRYVCECKRQGIRLGAITGDAESVIAKATGGEA